MCFFMFICIATAYTNNNTTKELFFKNKYNNCFNSAETHSYSTHSYSMKSSSIYIHVCMSENLCIQSFDFVVYIYIYNIYVTCANATRQMNKNKSYQQHVDKAQQQVIYTMCRGMLLTINSAQLNKIEH